MTALALGTGAGAVVDLGTRRIPNVVVIFTAAAGLALAAAGLSGVSLMASVGGAIMGFVLMLPGHRFGATGAGDVKLFAAAGAILGVQRVPVAFVLTLLAGGVLAVGFAVHRGRFVATCRRAASVVGGSPTARREIERETAHNRFPYGPAIAVGVTIAVLVNG